MSEIRYIISDASKMIDVEPHVLRYWEEELKLEIPRNEMGHRYYRPYDIKMLENIKALKNQGLQLKAIRVVLSNSNGLDSYKDLEHIKVEDIKVENKQNITPEVKEELTILSEENTKSEIAINSSDPKTVNTYSDKVLLFQKMIRDMLEEVVNESNSELSKTLCCSISENVIKQMDYLLRMNEEKEDERFKKLDESIREVQKSRKENGKKSRLMKIFG